MKNKLQDLALQNKILATHNTHVLFPNNVTIKPIQDFDSCKLYESSAIKLQQISKHLELTWKYIIYYCTKKNKNGYVVYGIAKNNSIVNVHQYYSNIGGTYWGTKITHVDTNIIKSSLINKKANANDYELPILESLYDYCGKLEKFQYWLIKYRL